MAELDNVSRKVLDDAEKERNKILDEAKEKASAIIEEAGNKKKELYKEGKLKAEDRYREVFDMEVFNAKSELNQKTLLYKIELVDKVIDRAKEKLSDLSKNDYMKFLEKNLTVLNLKESFYQIGSREENIDDKMIESIANLKKVDEKADFERGIKIIDGKTEYNISANSLIDADIDDIRMKVAFYLFGKEK